VDFFSPEKILRLQPGLNPRTRVPEVSMLTNEAAPLVVYLLQRVVTCVVFGSRLIRYTLLLSIHGVRNYHLAECQCCTILCTFCTVASPVLRVSTSEVSMEIMGPVSDNGETRPGPCFRCGRCSGKGFCCCHGHSCVTIVEHSQYAHCLQSSTDQAVCLLCTE
jgi:hypothetical protein